MAPSSSSIFRSYGLWGPRVSARVLLKTSENSWYSFGTLLMLAGIGSEIVLSRGEMNSWKVCTSSNFEIRVKAAALTKAMQGATSGVGGSDEIGADAMFSGLAKELAGFGVYNVILLNTQSINGLYQVSQLCPKTALQLASNGVTKNITECCSPAGKWIKRSTECWISELEDPSKSRNGIGPISDVWSLWSEMKEESRKQWVELESRRVRIWVCDMESDERSRVKEFGDERVDGLRWRSVIAPRDTMQPSSSAGPEGLLTDFLTPKISHWTSYQQTWCRWKRIGLSWL